MAAQSPWLSGIANREMGTQALCLIQDAET